MDTQEEFDRKNDGPTTIEIRKSTRSRLCKIGHKKQTYDDIICEMLGRLEDDE